MCVMNIQYSHWQLKLNIQLITRFLKYQSVIKILLSKYFTLQLNEGNNSAVL